MKATILTIRKFGLVLLVASASFVGGALVPHAGRTQYTVPLVRAPLTTSHMTPQSDTVYRAGLNDSSLIHLVADCDVCADGEGGDDGSGGEGSGVDNSGTGSINDTTPDDTTDTTTGDTSEGVSQGDAEHEFSDAGITWSSSGDCNDANNSSCTSFDDMNQTTVDDLVTFKEECHCPVNITGGTETGHTQGMYSHENGYKVDISTDPATDSYIRDNFNYIGQRGDNAPMYNDGNGGIYAREGNHWDITYR